MLFGLALPYLLMSGCENGFAALSGEEVRCAHSIDILAVLAENLWGWFVLSSMMLLLPVFVFWYILYSIGRAVSRRLGRQNK